MDDDFDDVSANDNGLDDLDIDENGIYRDLNLEQLDLDDLEESSSLHSLGESDLLNINEEGIWQDDVENLYTNYSNQQDSISDVIANASLQCLDEAGTRTDGRNNDGINISELEVSQSTSHRDSISDVFNPSIDATASQLQLPELATGYCTSDSEIRHQSAEKKSKKKSSQFVEDKQSKSGEQPNNYPLAASTVRLIGNRTRGKSDAQEDLGTEIHWMTSDDESSMTSRSRGDSDSDIKEFETLEKTLAESSPRTRLPVYVRRSASSCLQAGTSTDESPERVSARTTPGNLKRTCTVRQSKRYRDNNDDAPATAAAASYQDTQRSNDSKIPVLRSRSSSRSRTQSISRNLSQMSLRHDDDEPLRQEADVAPSMLQQGRRETEAVADMTSTFSRDGFTSNNHQIDDTIARSSDRLTANAHDRYRSSSAGIPSSGHLLTPNTATDTDQLLPLDAARQRRSRRSCSLERSVLAAPAGRKHRRHTLVSSTPALDPTATGSSSMDDSEDGDGSGTSRHKLKARFLAEMKERKRQEMTVKHLQQNYDDLLRSHAEKELAIEQLRLGARVSLLVDPPAPSHAETGSVAPARKPVLINIPRTGAASVGPVGSIGVQQQAKLVTISDILSPNTDPHIDNNRQQQGNRSDSHFKTTSFASHQSTSSANDNVNDAIDVKSANTVTSSPELLPATAAANNRRRSWLVSTADDIQKKMNEFEILLNHDMNLKLDEQLTVLSNLQNDFNNLRTAARRSSDGITTTLVENGHSSLQTGQLDELDVELEKLDQHLNKLSRRVQENVTSRTASNTALPLHGGGPMRADHSIRVDSVIDDVITGHVTGVNVRSPDGGYQQKSANSSRSSSRRGAGVTGAMNSTGNDVTDQSLSHLTDNMILDDQMKPMSPYHIDTQRPSSVTSLSARQSQHTAIINRPVNNAVRHHSSRTSNNETMSCSESESPSGGRRPDTHLSASETSAASELRHFWNPTTADNNNNNNNSSSSSKRHPTTSRQQSERTVADGHVTSDSNDSSRSFSRANRRLPTNVSHARHESSNRNKNSHRGQTSDVVTDVGRHGIRQKDTDSGYVGSTSTASRRDNQPGSRLRTGDSRTLNEHTRSEKVQPRSRTESIRANPAAVRTASDRQYTSSSESSHSSSADTVEERRVSKPAAAQRQRSTAAAATQQQQQPTLILQPIPVHPFPSQTAGVNLSGSLPQTFNATGNLLRSDLVVNRTALPGVNLMGFSGSAPGSVPLGGFNSTAPFNVPASTIPASAIVSSHATGPIPYAQLHTNGTVPAGYGLSSTSGVFPIQQLPAPDLSYRLGAGLSVAPPAATGYHQSPANQYGDGRGGYDAMADYAGMSRDRRQHRSQSVGQQHYGHRYRGNDSHGNGRYGQLGQPPVTFPTYAPGNPLGNDNQPLPSMYCEPSGAWFGGGPAATQDQNPLYTSRGIQNVPHTSSAGVQYSSVQSGGVGGSSSNQPVFLTGLACPLCGASHYHAHADCTENGTSALAAVAAANSVGSSGGHIGQHSTLVNAAVPAVVGNYVQQQPVVGATLPSQLTNAAVIGAAGPTGPGALHLTTHGQNGQQYVANSHGFVSMAPQTYSSLAPLSTAAGQQQQQQQQQQQPHYVDVGHTQRARVRYYVREYGDIPSDDSRSVLRHVTPSQVTPRRHRHHHTPGRSRSTNFRSDEQDSEADDDEVMLNASLSEAVATAKHLHSLSMRMKSSLRSELTVQPFRTLSLVDTH